MTMPQGASLCGGVMRQLHCSCTPHCAALYDLGGLDDARGLKLSSSPGPQASLMWPALMWPALGPRKPTAIWARHDARSQAAGV